MRNQLARHQHLSGSHLFCMRCVGGCTHTPAHPHTRPAIQFIAWSEVKWRSPAHLATCLTTHPSHLPHFTLLPASTPASLRIPRTSQISPPYLFSHFTLPPASLLAFLLTCISLSLPLLYYLSHYLLPSPASVYLCQFIYLTACLTANLYQSISSSTLQPVSVYLSHLTCLTPHLYHFASHTVPASLWNSLELHQWLYSSRCTYHCICTCVYLAFYLPASLYTSLTYLPHCTNFTVTNALRLFCFTGLSVFFHCFGTSL